MKILKLIFPLCFFLGGAVALADTPKEPVEPNPNADLKAPSISVQGLGNKIIEKASSSKFIVFDSNGIEYAYSIKKLGTGDVRYSGNPQDIEGLVFLEVTGFQDGRKYNTQLTTYRPSKYLNAIKLVKFDRDEHKPYEFDLGIDSEGRLIGITSLEDVTYFRPSDSIKKPQSAKDKYKDLIY